MYLNGLIYTGVWCAKNAHSFSYSQPHVSYDKDKYFCWLGYIFPSLEATYEAAIFPYFPKKAFQLVQLSSLLLRSISFVMLTKT
jgi:hypothetical protein